VTFRAKCNTHTHSHTHKHTFTQTHTLTHTQTHTHSHVGEYWAMLPIPNKHVISFFEILYAPIAVAFYKNNFPGGVVGEGKNSATYKRQ